jgi:hypothetical protein
MTREQLLSAYSNPLNYVENSTKKRLYLIYFLVALIMSAGGIILLYILYRGGHHQNSAIGDILGTSGGSNFKGIIVAIVLPFYGIFRLFTVKRSAAKHLQNKLVERRLPIDLDH